MMTENAKYFTLQDMVRIGCHDCKGCSMCCREMGNSVVLTPYDVHMLSIKLNLSVDALFQEWIQLSIIDGLLLPSMAMNGNNESCHALDDNGRCRIHEFRPSICRLFPLGRQYTEQGIQYFILEGACPAKDKSKVKISKWIQRIEFKEHEEFLLQWHQFKKLCMKRLGETKEEQYQKQLVMYVLQLFFRKPYTKEFYTEFLNRLKEAKNVLDME